MYRIIAINPDGSEMTLYDPVGSGALPILAPRSTEELREAGSLEFALVIGHEAYGLLEPKKTYIKADLNGREIFYGRVVNAEPSPMTGQIQYMCAGALSFLQDSEVPPDGKKSDGSSDYKTMTAEAFFRKCVDAHNADVGNDTRRRFSVGVINHSRKNESRQFQLNSYQDTKSVLDQNLLGKFGGFLRVRRGNDGGLLLDWVEQYGDTDEGILGLGRNIISLLNRIQGEELYTAIRPVGKDGLVLSRSQTMDLFPSAEMAEYGKIVKSVTFSDATTESELRSQAEELISKIQQTVVISSEIRLLDMVFTDEDDHGVNLGDVYTNILGLEGSEMTVSARNRDFENPQNDSCTLKNAKAYEGNALDELKAGSGGSLSQRSSRNSAGAGYAYKYIHEFQDRLELNTKQISINAEELQIHADKFVETANQFVRLSHVDETLQSGLDEINGTGVIQNSEHITQIAGRFRYNEATQDVELIEGSEFKLHRSDGAMITVGTRLTELGQAVATFEGSALWTQRNNITGIVGEFEVANVGGKRTLIVKSGGGMMIRRNNTQFGIYDEGNLTGGIMVQKLNGGDVVTKIRGDKIDITSNDNYTQLVADKNGLQTTVATHTNQIGSMQATVDSFKGSALWTQRNAITGVVGEFDVVTSSSGVKTLRIKSGGGLKILRDNVEYGVYDKGNLTGGVMVQKLNDNSVTTKIRGDHIDITTNDGYTQLVADKNGIQTTVNAHSKTLSTHESSIAGIKTRVDTIEGSALWTQRNAITGVVGEFDIVTVGSVKTLRIKSGGGLKILRNNVEYGVYDNGNLTGGIMVQKLNDNSVTTKIKGDKIDITTNDNYTQLVADKNGIQTTVNAHSTTLNTHESNIAGIRSRVDTIEGSALWTQRNSITGVVGEFEVTTSSTGAKILKVKSGGGMRIVRNNVEYGLYDNGNLTAGVIINKINGGTATIEAKNIILAGSTKISDVFSINSTGINSSKVISVSFGGKTCMVGASGVTGDVITARTDLVISNGGGALYDITYTTVGSMIKTAAKNGNTLTLTRFDGTTVDFNSATSLRGAWSGTGNHTNTFTVTASPQGNTISEVIGSTFGAAMGEYYIAAAHYSGTNWTSISNTSWTYKLGLSGTTVQVQNPSGVQYSNTPTYTIPLESRTIYANGTYTPNSGNVGMSQVIVNIQSTCSYLAVYDENDNKVSEITISKPTTFYAGCVMNGGMNWGSSIVVTPQGSSHTDKGNNWYCTIVQDSSGNRTCRLAKTFGPSQSVPFTNEKFYHLYT